MSSEIIGELGQVGLTIPCHLVDSGSPDAHLPEDDPLADTAGAGRKRSSHRMNRPKKFRHAWMMFDIFKDWLRPHSSPEFAMCIACNRVIKAGKSELEKHAAGKKHLKMLQGTQNNVFLPQDVQPQELSDSLGLDDSGASGTETNCSVGKEMGGHFGDTSAASESQFSTQSSFNMQRQQPVQTNETQVITKAIVTKPAPHWKAIAIVNGHVTRLDLSDYKGRYLILFFYPQDFSKLCASEVNTLSDRIAEFRALSTEVVACSTDSHLCHLAWIRTPRTEGGVGNSKIPILADPTHSITKDYGVYLEDRGHALRAHFIIDRLGVLRYMNVGDMKLGRGTDELLRVIKALQFTDDTEEGCPADWKPTVD